MCLQLLYQLPPPRSSPGRLKTESKVLAAGAVFLPFGSGRVGNINALQWSQIVVPVEACCLVATLVFVLFFRAPRRPLTATRLTIPAGVSFILQILMLLELVGLDKEISVSGRITVAYGCWVGIGVTFVGLAVSAQGYLGAKTATAAAQPYGTLPTGMPPLGYSPMPSQGGYSPLPQPGYPQSAPQPEYPMPQPQPGYPPVQPGPPPGGHRP